MCICYFRHNQERAARDGCFISRAADLSLYIWFSFAMCLFAAGMHCGSNHVSILPGHTVSVPTVPSNLHFIIRQSRRIQQQQQLFEFHHHNARHSTEKSKRHVAGKLFSPITQEARPECPQLFLRCERQLPNFPLADRTEMVAESLETCS